MTNPHTSPKRYEALPKKKPRVVIDARMVGPVPHGIARYVLALAQGLRLLAEHAPLAYEPVFLVRGSKRQGAENSQQDPMDAYLQSSFAPFEVVSLAADELGSEFLSKAELIKIPKLLRELRADLFHSPSFASWRSLPCPHVVTIHDLNHLHFGTWSQKVYYQLLLKPFAKTAEKILTVSEFSQKEIAQWLGIAPAQIEIAGNVIERSALPDSVESLGVLRRLGLSEGKYFLCLGNSKPHKNLRLLVQAYLDYCKNRGKQAPSGSPTSAWPLVLTVPPSFLSTSDFEKDSALSQVRCLAPQSDSVVQSLVAHCAGLFSPSLYEGFGLPPVEAAVAGKRVAVSRIPVHREVLSALKETEILWVDPHSSRDWSEAFEKIEQKQIAPPSEESQQSILDHFGVMKLGRKMDQIYREGTAVLPLS